MAFSRRLIPRPPETAGRSWEKVASPLRTWLLRVKDLLEGGVPAGFGNLTPTDVGATNAVGSETSGWAAADHTHKLDIVTTKGDLLGHSATAPSRLGIGADALNLTADAAQTVGFRWGPLVATPAQFTANVHDWAPGRKNVYRISSDAPRDLTGLVAGTDGEVRWSLNVGNFNITFKHNQTSAEANRWICPNGLDLVAEPGDLVIKLYDATPTRWRVFRLEGGTIGLAPDTWGDFWWPPHYTQTVA